MATETKATHTPGPWEISDIGPLDCLKPTKETCIEIASRSSILWVAQVLRGPSDGEANARLIAVAPELLSAAKIAAAELSARTPLGQMGHAELNLRTAIAKAEGQ